MELVRLACQLPEDQRRSLNHWTCSELAGQLVRSDVVASISAQTVQRILQHHRLKPWRSRYWLRAKTPRDADFIARTNQICDLYTRPLEDHEMVLCVDEKTSIQPRPRLAPTKPAQPNRPIQLEHEYRRAGALQLFAGFDTRSGRTYGRTYQRKRQVEFIDFLEYLDSTIPPHITVIHIVCDNVSTHHGKEVRAWLAKHPRFQFHFTPVHCSWMNQVEQWFSILQAKRLKMAAFKNLDDLATQIQLFISQWNEIAHPFNWTRQSFAKVLAKAEAALAHAA